jgi:hypothetical protein
VHLQGVEAKKTNERFGMSKKEDGGPAFPWGEHGARLGGMTLRDWFAGQAISGMFTNEMVLRNVRNKSQKKGIDFSAEVAFQAYTLADEMIKERNRE